MTTRLAARWLAYAFMTLSLAAAVLFKGGVHPEQWQWSALGLSLATIALILSSRRRTRQTKDRWAQTGLWTLAILTAWMLLALVPLPPILVQHLFPRRWSAALAARMATGHDPLRWLAFSLAPAATMERLLNVLPAMAGLIAARELGWWWRNRIWIAVAPVISVAWLESLLGLVQFYMMRGAGGEAGSATGTYVNRNHFAGLLEIAFPLAVMWTVSEWRKPSSPRKVSSAIRMGALVGVSACLLMGIVISLSRMGFFATVIASGLMIALALPWRPGSELNVDAEPSPRSSYRWRWIIPVAFPLGAALLLPTAELKQRFAYAAASENLSTDVRVGIWKDTIPLIAEQPWTGIGLGAYERGIYAYKTANPVNTLEFAHNDYLQVLAELGIPGALLVAMILVWIFRRLLSVVIGHRDARNWELAAGLFGAFVAISLHSLTDFNLYIPANALAFAWLGGLAVSPGLYENKASDVICV